MLKTGIKYAWIAGAVLLCVHSLAFARDIDFEVTLDRNRVSLGSTAQLSLTFRGTQQISRPQLPDIHGFTWRYLGPSTRMSIVNGRISSSITHIYILMPQETGEFMIPPLSVYYNGKTYQSDPIPIEVVRGPVGAGPPPATQKQQPVYDERVNTIKDRVFIIMQAGKRTAYLNELVPVTIKLYVNKLSVRDIQYPDFPHEGFSAEKFGEPRQYREVIGGVMYDVLEFTTTVSGVRTGRLIIGPAFIKCNVLLKKQARRRWSMFDDEDDPFSQFFGAGYEKHALEPRASDIPIEILPLPEEGKPEGFSGAVGDFRFTLKADPKDVKVGDPITLKMTVSGTGNFATAKQPFFDAGDDFKTYDPEVTQDGTRKTFETVIIPKNDTVSEIPEIRFPYFNTRTGAYQTITKGPIPITVRPLAKGEEPKIFETTEGAMRTARRREILGRDIIYIKDAPGPLRKRDGALCRNVLFIVFQFIPLCAVIVALSIQRRRTRLQTDIRYARRLRAPRTAKRNLIRAKQLLVKGDPGAFFDAVFKTLQEYLGDTFHLPSAGITSDVVKDLAPYPVDGAVLDKMKECFGFCDRARYAPSSMAPEEMHTTYRLLEEVIDALERMRL